MKTWKDHNGKTWTLEVHVSAVRELRSALGVDLMQVVEDQGDNLIGRLHQDVVLLADILYVLSREQCESHGITDVEFGRLLAGDAIDQATKAFLEELADFFPQGKRMLLRKVLERTEEAEARALAKAHQVLDRPELMGKVDALLENVGSSFTDARGLSESNPID